jgi:hypothetical protein
MGQNSEEAAELVATIRGDHVVMKNWYAGPSKDATALREKYGPYPGLWKEVLNWPGWKDARKAYLKFTQAGESSSAIVKEEETAIPRKRRSRWGNADDSNANEGAQKRRSRWGREEAPAAAPMLKPLPGLGLPGMPTNMSAEQQGEFGKCQSRLREVNSKIENLDGEAARVDALPRGHRERSPSPPPSKSMDCLEINEATSCCAVSSYHKPFVQFSFFTILTFSLFLNFSVWCGW